MAHGITQAQVAEAAEVSKQTVFDHLSGRAPLSPRIVDAVAALAGATVASHVALAANEARAVVLSAKGAA